MSEPSAQGTVAVNVDENAYQSLLSFAPRVEQGEVPSESNVSEVPEGRIVRLALAEGEGPDDSSVGEASGGRIVRLALTEGADGQQIIQEVPVDQATEMVTVPQDGSLVQHIQIQPLGQEITQGEAITLTLEEAQQLLQQQIVAGEGVEGMQPGIYQILSSGLTQAVDGQMFISSGEGISILQPGTSEALSGFEGQTAVSYFQPAPENLQSQLSEQSTVARVVNGSTDDNLNSGDGNHPQTSVSYEALTAVSLGRSETALLSQSVSSSQSENVLHVDFHIHQPENLLQLTSQTEASTVQSDSDAALNNGKLQGCSTSTVPTQGFLSPLGMSLPISVQASAISSGVQPVVTQQTQTGTNKQATESPTEEKKLILGDYKPKPVATPKKTGEIRPDLSKPIEVQDKMEVVVKGKKCMLAVDPDTGKLTAYPILPPEGTKKRGRPKKSEQEKREAAEAKTPTPAPDHTSRAAEGLLELSNTGPDGIRRSGRRRKKAKTLEDYEMLEVSSDDEGGIKVDEGEDEEDIKRLKIEQEDYVPPNRILLSLRAPTPTPVKRGRGRPRRYPPPGQSSSTQIPTMIIPTSDGQTIMMAPIQGLSNLQAFQEQIKNISIIPKNLTGATIAPITDGNGTAQIFDTSMTDQTSVPTFLDGADPASSGSPLLGDSVITGDVSGTTIVIRAKPDPQEIDTNLVNDPDMTQPNPGIGEPDIPDETVDPDVPPALEESEDATEDDPETNSAIDSLQDISRITVKNGENQPTIIQIPENLLPMFMQKKEPLKLGLKSSEDELEKMKCIKCNFQAYYEQQYQTHIATHIDDVHKCKACNFVSFEREDLLAHFREIHPKCICNVCDFMAEHGYVIKRHMMRHSADGCRCDICGKCYKDQYVLKMHIKMVHMPAEVLFECMICAKKFTRKAHLKRHLRIHDPEKPFKCPHCEYRGCERSDISKHLLIHEEPRHICEVCGKAFRHIKNKELHLKRHNGQRDYKCGVCDFYGYTFTDIRKHIERKHTDAKTIICDKCGAAFKTDWHLREHQRLGNCEMFMIEQALAIATSDGNSSKATIQTPTSMSLEGVIDGHQMQINGQNVILDLNAGQYSTKDESVKLSGEAVTLTEEQIQEAVAQGQIIDTTAAEGMIMQVTETGVHSVKLGAVGDVCLTDNEEEHEEEDEDEEEEETEDDINMLNRNIQSMVSEMSD